MKFYKYQKKDASPRHEIVLFRSVQPSKSPAKLERAGIGVLRTFQNIERINKVVRNK